MKNGLIVDKDGTKSWFLDDKLHRTDGPAVEHFTGSKVWCVDGKTHRIDGPAFEGTDGTKGWWFNGMRHRLDGPTIEQADGTSWWYFEDKFLGRNQEGFWALWAKLTPGQQNNVNILQWWTKYTEGAKC